MLFCIPLFDITDTSVLAPMLPVVSVRFPFFKHLMFYNLLILVHNHGEPCRCSNIFPSFLWAPQSKLNGVTALPIGISFCCLLQSLLHPKHKWCYQCWPASFCFFLSWDFWQDQSYKRPRVLLVLPATDLESSSDSKYGKLCFVQCKVATVSSKKVV